MTPEQQSKLDALAAKAKRITGNVIRASNARGGKSTSQMATIHDTLHAKKKASIFIGTKNVHWFKLRYKEMYNEEIHLTPIESKLESENENVYELSL